MSLSTQINAFLEARFEQESAYPLSRLIEQIEAEKLDAAQVETLVRTAHAPFPDASEFRGNVTQHKMHCNYTGRSFDYFLFVPDSYREDVANPLVVVAHGGNNAMPEAVAFNTAFQYLQAYSSLGTDFDYILAVPATSKGWGPVGVAAIFSMISGLSRQFFIDPDRIHLTGQSMGGHLAYRMALWYSDRFGALSPHSGGYDFAKQEVIENLLNTQGYVVFGEHEPYGIKDDNLLNAQWLAQHHAQWIFREKKGGGHDIYPDEMPNIAQFFDQNPRNLYQKEIRMKVKGSLKFEGENHANWGNVAIPPLSYRTYSANSRYWLRLLNSENRSDFMEIQGKITAENHIFLHTKNVSEIEIGLHPKMLNWNEKVSIFLNGKKVWEELPQANIADMLELVREYDDRGRIFWQRLRFQV